jgi:hypothetical protein
MQFSKRSFFRLNVAANLLAARSTRIKLSMVFPCTASRICSKSWPVAPESLMHSNPTNPKDTAKSTFQQLTHPTLAQARALELLRTFPVTAS